LYLFLVSAEVPTISRDIARYICSPAGPARTGFQWLNSAGTGQDCVPPSVSGVPQPEIVFHHLKLSFRHHLGEIIKIVPTRGHVLRLKCSKYYFGWGSTPDPAEGDYSACPEPLEGGQPTSKEMGGKEGKRRGEH